MKCQKDLQTKLPTGKLTATQKAQTRGENIKPTELNQPGTVAGEETFSTSSLSALGKKPIQPSEEIIAINSLGQVINQPCSHAKIPGLDADFCKTCRVWWVDQQSRDLWFARKAG